MKFNKKSIFSCKKTAFILSECLITQEALKELLLSLGYQNIEVSNRASYLINNLKISDFDMIFVDSSIDGIQEVMNLKGIPTVVLIDYKSEIKRFRNLNKACFVKKPINYIKLNEYFPFLFKESMVAV